MCLPASVYGADETRVLANDSFAVFNWEVLEHQKLPFMSHFLVQKGLLE